MGSMALVGLILKYGEMAIAAAKSGGQALSDFNELKDKLNAMKEEGRDPTQEEFQALLDRTHELSDRLDAADKRLNG